MIKRSGNNGFMLLKIKLKSKKNLKIIILPIQVRYTLMNIASTANQIVYNIRRNERDSISKN